MVAGKARTKAVHYLYVLRHIEVGRAWKQAAKEGGNQDGRMLLLHLISHCLAALNWKQKNRKQTCSRTSSILQLDLSQRLDLAFRWWRSAIIFLSTCPNISISTAGMAQKWDCTWERLHYCLSLSIHNLGISWSTLGQLGPRPLESPSLWQAAECLLGLLAAKHVQCSHLSAKTIACNALLNLLSTQPDEEDEDAITCNNGLWLCRLMMPRDESGFYHSQSKGKSPQNTSALPLHLLELLA